ncbi:hypothetical protein Cylst_0043 [Cylindrospermum stagnale PCC 7417]|uniref:Uncharacterized protein n=1 Tax=Cylindrospermum stagnale PCC 7417 TaxID=56107 RepID=K9WPV6_9NOST|nr:hypothetical protein [Cylindrospermum stagnale]AFZ22425.1 hypothetical protein Cylst_0043 [Cylindrospermum stagnale PCC 7417]
MRHLWQYVGASGNFMGNKNHRKAIRSLNARIAEHQEKIRLEYEKNFPDEGLIRHWENEICAFDKGIQQALKRLGK